MLNTKLVKIKIIKKIKFKLVIKCCVNIYWRGNI